MKYHEKSVIPTHHFTDKPNKAQESYIKIICVTLQISGANKVYHLTPHVI